MRTSTTNLREEVVLEEQETPPTPRLVVVRVERRASGGQVEVSGHLKVEERRSSEHGLKVGRGSTSESGQGRSVGRLG